MATATQPPTPDQQEMVFLIVDKSNLRADLRTWPADWTKSEILMSFRIAIGKEEGDKQTEGDNRTPEGIYFTQSIIDGSTLPAKYGPKAIPINFPNPFDQMLGKTGYGIWLHGVEKDQRVEEAKVTEGCVAFYNADILSLTKWLRPQQTVVVIARNGASVNTEVDMKKITQLTNDWLDAWRNKDIERYISFYREGFSAKGYDLGGYKKYKANLFEHYDKMELTIDSLRVFVHEKYAMAIMNQDFNGDDRFISKGRKVLYWRKSPDGEWKISNEIFESKKLEFTSYSHEDFAQIFKNSPSYRAFNKESSAASNL
jgi:murein L,D-transpeptidase YafK